MGSLQDGGSSLKRTTPAIVPVFPLMTQVVVPAHQHYGDDQQRGEDIVVGVFGEFKHL